MLGICMYVPPTRIDFSLPKMQNRPRIWNSSGTGPDFQRITQEHDPFLTIWSQTSKVPVAFLKNDRPSPNFHFKKYSCFLSKHTGCVPVTIIINKLYSNKLMLPMGTLVSYSLMSTYSCKNSSKNNSKNNNINKRVECFHFCSVILKQRVPSFL